jgi:hypothetical protein
MEGRAVSMGDTESNQEMFCEHVPLDKDSNTINVILVGRCMLSSFLDDFGTKQREGTVATVC